MKNKALIQNIFVFIALVAPFVYAYMIWDMLPEQVALHYGMDNKPNRYGSKSELFLPVCLIMGVSLIVYFIVKNIEKIDPKRTAKTPKDTLNKLAFTLMIFMSGLSIYILQAALKNETSSFIFVLIGLLFIAMGNLMHSLKPSYFIGIRLPWTLENEDNWRKTHQLGSKIWVAGGLVMLLAALIAPEKIMVLVVIGVALLMVAIPAVYSYQIHQKNA